MDKKCIECEHFRRGSVGPTRPEYVWGDCLKVREHAWGSEESEESVNFTWADGCCENFEPRQTSADDRRAATQ